MPTLRKKTTEYAVEATVFVAGDYFDVSKVLSVGPTVYESQKYTWGTMLDNMGENFVSKLVNDTKDGALVFLDEGDDTENLSMDYGGWVVSDEDYEIGATPIAIFIGDLATGFRLNIEGPGTISSDKIITFRDIGGSVALLSDFSAYAPLAGATFTGYVILHADPTNAFHAATKSYVDNLITGLTWKTEVFVATTANITLSGEQVIDGEMTDNSRVLVRAQSAGEQDGIYLSGPGAWTRVSDADTGAELAGATVMVAAGGTYANTQWSCSNNEITLGVTSVNFVQISGAGTYTNGTYLSLTGNVFDLDFASFTTDNITEGATNLYYTAALDALALHKAGSETITGTKSFSVSANFANNTGIVWPTSDITNNAGVVGINAGNRLSIATSNDLSIYLTSTTTQAAIALYNSAGRFAQMGRESSFTHFYNDGGGAPGKIVISGTYPGSLSSSGSLPNVVISRDVTLGAFDATGAVLQVNDNTASTGNLLEIIKLGTTKLSFSSAYKLTVTGTFQFITGNEGASKVWTSDGSGNADWAAIPAGITGLTTGYIPLAASSTTISNSIIYSDGTGVALNNAATVPANNLFYLKGIGTSTKYTIHLVDSAAADTFYVQDNGNTYVKGTLTIGNLANAGKIVYTDSAGKLIITSNININGATLTVSGADNAININNTTTTGTDYALHVGAFSTALTTGQFGAAGWFNYRGTAQGSMNVLMLEQNSSNALANTMGVSLSFGYKGAIHGYLEHKIPTITGGSEETTLSVYNRSVGSLVESIRFDGKNAKLLQVGGGIYVKEGSNATMGTATLVGGTVVVSTTKVTANSRVFISMSTAGGTQGVISYTISAGTSFTVTSTSGTDTSTFNWIIIEPS